MTTRKELVNEALSEMETLGGCATRMYPEGLIPDLTSGTLPTYVAFRARQVLGDDLYFDLASDLSAAYQDGYSDAQEMRRWHIETAFPVQKICPVCGRDSCAPGDTCGTTACARDWYNYSLEMAS